MCNCAALVFSVCSIRVWFITLSEGVDLNNNCSSVLWKETAEGFSGIWTFSHKAAVWKDLSCQPVFITSLHRGQHLNQFVCVCVGVCNLYPTWLELECQLLFFITSPSFILHLNVSACMFVCVKHAEQHTASQLYGEIYWPPCPLIKAPASDRHIKWRQMVDGSWPLTLVIRYGCSNWLAVFSINRHYGSLLPACAISSSASWKHLVAAERLFLPAAPYKPSLLLYFQPHYIDQIKTISPHEIIPSKMSNLHLSLFTAVHSYWMDNFTTFLNKVLHRLPAYYDWTRFNN